MKSDHLVSHVYLSEGLTTFSNNPGTLTLDGTNITFVSDDGDKKLEVKVNDIKEFNVTNWRSGMTWIIISKDSAFPTINFIRKRGVKTDNSYKDWIEKLSSMGVSTSDDTKFRRLVMSLCFGTVIFALLLMILIK